MKAIFLGEERTINQVYTAFAREKLCEKADIDTSAIFSKDDLATKNLKDTEYIFSTWGMPSLAEEEIKESFPNLKAVFYAAGTVKEFAKAFLNCGVRIFSAASANAIPVAEVTLAQILLATKGFFHHTALGNKQIADLKKTVNDYCGNMRTKIGIIGAGAIGKLVIEKLRGFDNEVLVFDPFLTAEQISSLGGKKATLKEIFGECIVISNHLADKEETKGILNYYLFSLMQKNSVFLNTGRGAQVNEADLTRALNEDKSRIAVLDVTHPEPPEENHPFYTMDNVILTPHFAGSSGNEVERMAIFMIDEFERVKNGVAPLYEVTIEMLERMA